MRGLDLWQQQRERADVLEGGLRALREEVNGKPALKMWQPKAIKPFVNTWFRSAESREAYVTERIASLKAHKERRAQYKAERKGTPEQVEAVKVGAIFHYSWGYDQTNAQYFEVIEKHGRQLTLREIAQETVPGSQGFMSSSVKARPGVFLENEKPFTKLLQFGYKGEPSIAMDHGACSIWRGEANYSSWYA